MTSLVVVGVRVVGAGPTFGLAALFSEYCAFFDLSERAEEHAHILLGVLPRQHPHEQLPLLC